MRTIRTIFVGKIRRPTRPLPLPTWLIWIILLAQMAC